MRGGLVLSATINRYAHATLRPGLTAEFGSNPSTSGPHSSTAATEPIDTEGQLGLVQAAIRRVAQLEEPQGYRSLLAYRRPPGSGLGASSALIVSLIGVLADYHKVSLTDYELAHLAWEVERIDLGLKGGLQDHYAAAFGGFNFMEFKPNGVIVNPLRIKPDIANELESNLLLVFTGATRAGDHIIDDQTRRYEASESDALDGLRMQKSSPTSMKEALLRGRLTTFGELMGTAWEYKKRMSPRISTQTIDEAYHEATEHGAIGGKVTGAGGGGFMLFYCRPGRLHRVADRLRQMGLEPTDFAFDYEGLKNLELCRGLSSSATGCAKRSLYASCCSRMRRSRRRRTPWSRHGTARSAPGARCFCAATGGAPPMPST